MNDTSSNLRYHREWVTKYTSRGHTYQSWEAVRMPRIPDEMLDCAIYLYRTAEEAASGVDIGGSGFIVDIPSRVPPPGGYLFAVSNRHVVCGSDALRTGASPVIRLNTQGGVFDVIEKTPDDWIVDPFGNDLAVCPLGLSMETHRLCSVSTTRFASRERVQKYNIGPGDDAFMVGRFINHEGRQRNLPTVRHGHISMMPHEPVYHPWNANREQESYLVEIHSIGGYSGSPVFVELAPFQVRPDVGPVREYGPWLLGVEWANLSKSEYVRDRKGDPLTGQFSECYANVNTGMSAVIPAWVLLNLLSISVIADDIENSERELAVAARRSGVIPN